MSTSIGTKRTTYAQRLQLQLPCQTSIRVPRLEVDRHMNQPTLKQYVISTQSDKYKAKKM